MWGLLTIMGLFVGFFSGRMIARGNATGGMLLFVGWYLLVLLPYVLYTL